MSGLLRRCAALLGVCALSFSTVSVAAYTCPGSMVTTEAASSPMPDGCPAQDARQPNLCKAHCTSNDQRTTQAAADLPPLPLVHGLLTTLYSTTPAPSITARDASGPMPSRIANPPLNVQNCCFRL